MITSDTEGRGPAGPASVGDKAGSRPAEAVRQAAKEAGDRLARDGAEIGKTAREEASAIGEEASARVRSAIDDGRKAGAGAVHSVADAARSAADDLERTSPDLAHFTREAAAAVDDVSDAIRSKGLGDLVRSADDFARREPLAFFGTALVAGFAVTRFLGSSARHRQPTRSAYGDGAAQRRYPEPHVERRSDDPLRARPAQPEQPFKPAGPTAATGAAGTAGAETGFRQGREAAAAPVPPRTTAQPASPPRWAATPSSQPGASPGAGSTVQPAEKSVGATDSRNAPKPPGSVGTNTNDVR